MQSFSQIGIILRSVQEWARLYDTLVYLFTMKEGTEPLIDMTYRVYSPLIRSL